MRHTLCIVIAFVLPLSAGAQEEVCEAALTSSDVDWVLGQIDDAMAKMDKDTALSMARTLRAETRCLSELVTREQLGRLAIARAELAFWDQDEEDVHAWASVASSLDVLPPPHASAGVYMRMLHSGEPNRRRTLHGKALSLPKNTVMYLDGTPLLEPAAAPDVPHLVQIVTKDEVVESYWQDGLRFREGLLTDVDVAPLESVVVYTNARRGPSPAGVGLLTTGALLVAGGAGAGVASWTLTQGDTTDLSVGDANTLRITNIAGWSALGAGAALATAGIIALAIDGDGARVRVAVAPTNVSVSGQF